MKSKFDLNLRIPKQYCIVNINVTLMSPSKLITYLDLLTINV